PQIPCMMIGDVVNINVMATDPDDAVLRYDFQNLPPGVLHADMTSGQLTGIITPDAVPGNYDVTVTVTDGAGNVAMLMFTWCIEPPVVVCTPDPLVDLVGHIYQDADTGVWTGSVENQSEHCTYDVGFASYSKPSNKLQDQVLFDADPMGNDGFDLLPGEFVLLTVDVPECAAQLDLYFDASHLGVYDDYSQVDADMPPLTLPAFFTGDYGTLGDKYGPRLISSLHIGGDHYCGEPEPDRDADWDGFPDHEDACPREGDWGLGLDSTGCPYKDTDGDTVFDRDDVCPMRGNEGGLGVDADGCPYYDADWDGVYDRNDSCPARGDEYGNGIDATGCPIPDTPETPEPDRDADWDGYADSADACPREGDWGLGLDSTGCPYKDTDGDTVFDRNDSCPARGNEYGYGIDATGCPIRNTPETTPETESGT
ncbi:MAG: Ig domain-containing protein, partial [Aggregatilineales bacterium]